MLVCAVAMPRGLIACHYRHDTLRHYCRHYLRHYLAVAADYFDAAMRAMLMPFYFFILLRHAFLILRYAAARDS